MAARGRPRDETVDAAVLRATIELLATAPYSQLTVSAIARRAGVGKPSVYLRWPTKQAIVVDAVAEVMGTAPFPDRGSLRDDLTAGLADMIRRLRRSVVGAVLPALLADLRHDPELAETFRRRYFEPRWASIEAAVDRAVARGDVPAGVDVRRLIDALTAPVYYRMLVPDGPLRADDAEGIVDVVLAAVDAGALDLPSATGS